MINFETVKIICIKVGSRPINPLYPVLYLLFILQPSCPDYNCKVAY